MCLRSHSRLVASLSDSTYKLSARLPPTHPPWPTEQPKLPGKPSHQCLPVPVPVGSPPWICERNQSQSASCTPCAQGPTGPPAAAHHRLNQLPTGQVGSRAAELLVRTEPSRAASLHEPSMAGLGTPRGQPACSPPEKGLMGTITGDTGSPRPGHESRTPAEARVCGQHRLSSLTTKFLMDLWKMVPS